MLGYLATYALGTYLVDVPMRRKAAAARAMAYARVRGKPVLNIGAGTPETSLQGACLDGDVNIDLNGRRDVPHGTPGVVTFGNAQDLREFRTGAFGAVLASHILEHLPDPNRALSEWLRVAGYDVNALHVVTPSWWAPHTWLHPGHLHYFADGQGCLTGCRPERIRQQLGLSATFLPIR